jgi:hypothetical protein
MSVQSMPPTYLQINLLQVIAQMYRMAGVLTGPGRGLSGSEQDEGLHIVNAILDGVKTERFFFYQILRTLFDTEVDVKDYTIGDPGLAADWELERPEKLLGAGYIVPNGAQTSSQAEIPMYVVQSFEEYKSLVCKEIKTAYPQVIYYQASLPLGTATIWPIPNQIYQIVLYTPETVQEFTDINSDFIVPKGYREFMEYAGAVGVHNRYPDRHMDPDVRVKAEQYKARVKMQQLTPAFMKSDPAALARNTQYASWVFNGRTLVP